MNVEEIREYCLTVGTDVVEKTPFVKFHGAESVLAFYVGGHIFCYFDFDKFDVVTVKCQPARIADLRESCDYICDPFNMSPKYWIGIRAKDCPDAVMKELIANSYAIVGRGEL